MKIIIAIILSTFYLSAISQDTLTSKELRALRQEMARTQINALKNGVLLIQLKTRQNTIDAYKKRGASAKAEKIKEAQAADNKSIVKGFKNHFTFCPTYFYYSTDQKAVEKGDFKTVTFLDENLSPIQPNINLDTTTYFISGISKSNFSNTTLNNIPNYKIPYEKGIKFDAFIIKNKDFQQLSSPFPYYAKTHVAVKVNDKKRWESIKKLNARLHNYYR